MGTRELARFFCVVSRNRFQDLAVFRHEGIGSPCSKTESHAQRLYEQSLLAEDSNRVGVV